MTDTTRPLAARMRPTTLDEVVGQDHLIYPGSPLPRLADPDDPTSTSVLLYGPPGTGKTTIASVIAQTTGADFITLSATSAGVKDVRSTITTARESNTPTIVFIDEIHRFSKSQQDALLPAVEDGTITLIGATTENPSFSVNSALNSRTNLLRTHALTTEDITTLIERALTDDRGLPGLSIDPSAASTIARLASGDARTALTLLDTAGSICTTADRTQISNDDITQAADGVAARYDRNGDMHYDVISAFIKSMRGSDPDAAVYWLARLIDAGEDPRFIARRLIVHASEDVGMADPTVLQTCVAAAQAVQLVGLPEARINLTQAVLAVATAPKSNGVIKAINAAQQLVSADPSAAVPVHLRDSHYPGAKLLGHGDGYRYPHDHPGHVTDVAVDYLPESIRGLADATPTYHGPPSNKITGGVYVPTANGQESVVRERLTGIHTHQTKD